MNYATLEVIKLTDGSKVYSVIIRAGLTPALRLETISRDSAQTIIDAINNGIIGVVTLARR